MTRRSMVVSALAAAAFLAGCGGDGAKSSNGPLIGEGVHYGQPVALNEPYSVGTVRLGNEGDEPVVVERVRLVGVRGPLEMLGVSTRYLPAPPGAFLGTAGFPPASFPTKDLSEQRVVPVAEERTPEGLPDKVMQLAIGVKVTAPGETAVRGVEVTYRVGDKTYIETFERHFYLCAPKEQYAGEDGCSPKLLEGSFGDRTLE